MVFYSTLLLTFLCSAHALPTDLTRYFGRWLIVGTDCCCPGRTQPRMWWMSTRSRRRRWTWKTRRRSMRPRRFWDPSLLSLSHILRGRDLWQDIGRQSNLLCLLNLKPKDRERRQKASREYVWTKIMGAVSKPNGQSYRKFHVHWFPGSHWDFSLLRRRTGSWVFQPHQQRRRKTSTFRRRASEEWRHSRREEWRVSPSSATFPLATFSHLLFQLHPMLILKLSKKQPSLIWKVLVCLPGSWLLLLFLLWLLLLGRFCHVTTLSGETDCQTTCYVKHELPLTLLLCPSAFGHLSFLEGQEREGDKTYDASLRTFLSPSFFW